LIGEKPKPSDNKLYPYKHYGMATVRCRNCGEMGKTNQRLVGRAKLIDMCGECKKNPDRNSIKR